MSRIGHKEEERLKEIGAKMQIPDPTLDLLQQQLTAALARAEKAEKLCEAMNSKIKSAISDIQPSAGHDYIDELLGLLRVMQSQRDTAERAGFRLATKPPVISGALEPDAGPTLKNERDALKQERDANINPGPRALQSRCDKLEAAWRAAIRCPSCRNTTLIIGSNGELVCSWIECKDPTAINKLGAQNAEMREALQSVLDITSGFTAYDSETQNTYYFSSSLCYHDALKLLNSSDCGKGWVRVEERDRLEAALHEVVAAADDDMNRWGTYHGLEAGEQRLFNAITACQRLIEKSAK